MLSDKQRAERNYPGNETLQQKWLAAVAFLRKRGSWILEGGRAKWGNTFLR